MRANSGLMLTAVLIVLLLPSLIACDGEIQQELQDKQDDSQSLIREFELPLPLFAARSAWNQKATEAEDLPESDDQILALYRVLLGDSSSLYPSGTGMENPFPFMFVNFDDYSIPVYKASKRKQKVLIRDYEGSQWWPGSKFPDDQKEGGPVKLPTPDGKVRPAGPRGIDSDGHLVLYDPDILMEYDFWQATTILSGSKSRGGGFRGNKIFEAGAVDFFDVRRLGVNRKKNSSARATGVPLLAGLVLPEDVEGGAIEHALACAIPGLRNLSDDPNEPLSSDYFYPATTTETDFLNTGKDALAAGQRIRLKKKIVDDQGDPVDEDKIAPITHIFLKALRTYGAYMVDNAGGFVFYAEDIHTADFDLSDEEVKILIGQPDEELPEGKSKWQIVMETLDKELEQIPLAYGSWEEDQDPATATVKISNFEVVEPALEPSE